MPDVQERKKESRTGGQAGAEVRIGTLDIGANSPVAVICEIGNAHNQDYGRAVRLLDAAKTAGASVVKLQCFDVEELISLRGDGSPPPPWDHMTMRELYGRAMTPRDWFGPLYAHARAIGLPIFSSVFGPRSLALLESVGNPCYKLASLDMGNQELREMVQATGKPLIRSCAFDSPPGGPGLKCYCPPGYPQRKFDLRYLRNYDGFSYHGTTFGIPVIAAIMGASFVEVHFQLKAEPSVLESAVSLNEDDVAEIVRDIRDWEKYL